jgi:rhamnosyltransferase
LRPQTEIFEKNRPLNCKIFGVVVTYFPSDDLADHLARISAQIEAFAVIDNSAAPEVAARVAALAKRFGAKPVLNPENLGIAAALNIGVALALEARAARVAFFDQDSEIFPEFLSENDAIWSACAGGPPLGIVGSNFLAGASGRAQYRTGGAQQYVQVCDVMTSASVYDMAMLAKLGPFADAYFIDSIDIEYCWRAKTNGYTVCRSTKPLLKHSIGCQTDHSLLGLRVKTSNHPAWRRYYMIRNTLFLVRTYYRRLPRPCRDRLVRQLEQSFWVCLCERNRWGKLGFCLLGLVHGLFASRTAPPRIGAPHANVARTR